MSETLRSKRIFARTSVVGLLLGFLLSSLSIFGQSASGNISGTVADASGAVIPKAEVVMTDEGTNSKRQTLSNNSGVFNFAAVLPGTYTVTVTANGFRPWEERTIVMTQGNNLNLPNIALQVGTSKQEVLVVGNEVTVPTDTGAVTNTLNESMITELAIQGRDAAELMKIMPGMGNAQGLTQSMFSSLTTQSNTGPIGTMSAQGTQLYGGLTMMADGASLLDPGNMGTQTANINQNQIQEVSLLTSAYGAEYAKGPIVFQALGKSGSSAYHGGAYLYARNGVFNSTDSYFKANDVAKPNDSYYYPGGDIGGPVVLPWTHFNHDHDKLFFYAAYENMRQNPEGSINQRFIPTAQMMDGNFSPAYLQSLGSNFLNGSFGNNGVVPCQSTCTNNTTFPGGMIPQSLLDPNSAALYKTFPAANTAPSSNDIGANYTQLLSLPVNRWELRLRGDYNISQKTKAFFSWNRQDETDLNPNNIWWGTGNDLPYPTQMPAKQVSQVYSANVTHIFSPTLTNEFVFADATFLNPVALANPAAVDPAKLGFKLTGLFPDTFTPQIPNTLSWSKAVPGYFAPTFGQAFEGGDFGKLSQAPNISDNITKVAGTHLLKFGIYWDYSRNWQANSNFSTPSQGLVEFETYAPNTTGNGAADFATARLDALSQQSAEPVQDVRFYQYAFYINDQWKATRRLTLTLGVRFDHLGNWVDTNQNLGLAVWNPSTYNNSANASAWTGVQWHGIDSSVPLSGVPSKAFFAEPRLGVAYDLFGTGKTVLRGGFGVYRYQASANNVASGNYSVPLGLVIETTTGNACCFGYNNFAQFSPSLGAAGLGGSLNGIDQEGDTREPYAMTYNFTISQRAPWRSLVEVQYSGSASRDQILDGPLSDQNLVPLGAFFGTDPITGTVVSPYSSSFNGNDYYRYHNYPGGIQLFSHGGYSNYNAFITTWQKQTGRTTFTTNYTFSKVMGTRDGQTFNGNSAGNELWPYALGPNYGVLAYDHTQIFNAAYVVNLPSPIKGGNHILGGVVNGWEFSGITQLQSGPPLQPNTTGLNPSYGSNANGATSAQTYLGTNSIGTLLPVLTCDPRKGLSSGQYFNPSCFTPPVPGQVGNIIWPYIKGPALFNSDLSLYKNFRFREKQKIQLRFEAFNFLNHPLPEFNATGNNADDSLRFSNSAGSLTPSNTNADTTGKPLFTVNRRVIEFAIKYNF